MPIVIISLAVLAGIVLLMLRALRRYEPQHAGPRPDRPGLVTQNRAQLVPLPPNPYSASGPWLPPTPRPARAAAAISGPRITARRVAQLAPIADAEVLAIRLGIREWASRENAGLFTWSAHMQRVALWMP